MTKFFWIGLIFCFSLSLFLHLSPAQIPICLNADELAFSYNARSIAGTLRDEHGTLLPLRLRSFDDYKLPFYSYLSIPFVKLFAGQTTSIRYLNIIVGLLFIPLSYLLAKELFEKKEVGFVASLFASSTLWIFIITKHAHEAALSALFTLLATYFFVKLTRWPTARHLILLNISLLLAAFSYHPGRLFLIFFVAAQLFLLFVRRGKNSLSRLKGFSLTIIITLCLITFGSDILYGASRVENLLFYKRAGFELRINEYMGEHPNRLVHNKATEGLRELSSRYLAHFSTDFLLQKGDSNPRFGYDYMAPITPVFYLLVLIGIYFSNSRKNEFRHLLLLLLLLSPLGNALTYQEASLTRSYFMIFPMLLFAAYGFINLFESIAAKWRYFVMGGFIVVHLFFIYYSFDLYFNHYFKRALVLRAWQCGYSELFSSLSPKVAGAKKIYITERYGQPYIFALHHLQIDPKAYQNKAVISPPDEYGFSQVKSYDKFIFDFTPEKLGEKGSVFVGFKDEFDGTGITEKQVEKIKIGTEEIFWIYESK